MIPCPRWFLPGNHSRPAHLPPGGIATLTGPTREPGLCVGGPIVPDEAGWQDTGKGWWVHLAGCVPAQLLRLTPVPGPIIPGADPDHQWQVPQLLNPTAGGLVCSLPQVLTDAGFAPPPAFAGLMGRLRDLMVPAMAEMDQASREQRQPVLGLAESDATQLAIDLLTVNYHVSRAELIVTGWLTDHLAARVLFSACGLTGDGHG